MLATNVDVPVFFRILIPSRNVVNWKGQLPPTMFPKPRTHTHSNRTSDPQAHRATESQSQARTVTEGFESSIIIFICLTSSSLSSLFFDLRGVVVPPRSFGLICLASSYSSSLSLGAVGFSSLSLDLLSVVVVVLLAFA